MMIVAMQAVIPDQSDLIIPAPGSDLTLLSLLTALLISLTSWSVYESLLSLSLLSFAITSNISVPFNRIPRSSLIDLMSPLVTSKSVTVRSIFRLHPENTNLNHLQLDFTISMWRIHRCFIIAL